MLKKRSNVLTSTGLCIVSAEGVPTDEDAPFAARTLETVEPMVAGIAAKRPARSV
jgi:hypothetical protein